MESLLKVKVRCAPFGYTKIENHMVELGGNKISTIDLNGKTISMFITKTSVTMKSRRTAVSNACCPR